LTDHEPGFLIFALEELVLLSHRRIPFFVFFFFCFFFFQFGLIRCSDLSWTTLECLVGGKGYGVPLGFGHVVCNLSCRRLPQIGVVCRWEVARCAPSPQTLGCARLMASREGISLVHLVAWYFFVVEVAYVRGFTGIVFLTQGRLILFD